MILLLNELARTLLDFTAREHGSTVLENSAAESELVSVADKARNLHKFRAPVEERMSKVDYFRNMATLRPNQVCKSCAMETSEFSTRFRNKYLFANRQRSKIHWFKTVSYESVFHLAI